MYDTVEEFDLGELSLHQVPADRVNRKYKQKKTIQEEFEEFHRANPDVYNYLVSESRLAKAMGHEKLGIQMLWERLRWEVFIVRKADATYKLSNNHTSRYARRIMEQEPDLAGFFMLKGLARE